MHIDVLSKIFRVVRSKNQWSVLAILLFAKNADNENEKCLKIKVILCISLLKLKKRIPLF